MHTLTRPALKLVQSLWLQKLTITSKRILGQLRQGLNLWRSINRDTTSSQQTLPRKEMLPININTCFTGQSIFTCVSLEKEIFLIILAIYIKYFGEASVGEKAESYLRNL
jgi:hypothetical protein